MASTVETRCGKTGWRSRASALAGVSAVARANGDRRMRVYQCPECHYWHATAVGRTT